MSVFISWSGEKSREVARAFHVLLRFSLSTERVNLSEEFIRQGKVWFDELTKAIADSTFCVVIATPDSFKSPWVQFEAGAIWRTSQENSVSALLVHLNVDDIRETPLSSFQNTQCDANNVLSLVKKIKQALSIDVGDDVIERNFVGAWREFEQIVTKIDFGEAGESVSSEPRDASDLIEEKLESFERYLAARESALLKKIQELSERSIYTGTAAAISGQGPLATATPQNALDILNSAASRQNAFNIAGKNPFLPETKNYLDTPLGIESLLTPSKDPTPEKKATKKTNTKKK
ncbi:MAG: toll/interleukin-1 receptor domain-containing protein [Hyphomonadaceae bacterium]|nr:toll/interleukin-1 receptor domain-containing protein [Hyphomonadaceae bacterium]